MNAFLTYDDKDDLEDGAGFVSAPVGIAEEGADEGEDVNGSGPFADAVGGVGIVLLKNPC